MHPLRATHVGRSSGTNYSMANRQDGAPFLFYGIRMHVAKLLDHFLLGKDIEIEIASLPEPALLVLGVVESQPQLCRGPEFPSSHPARHALFEDLHHRGGRHRRRLAD